MAEFPASPLPLSALLSQALVAFTIELDNCFEQRVPTHTTDLGGRRRGSVWATSLRQWSNFMRLVDADGVTVAELERRAGGGVQLDGMRRWRYVTVEPGRDGIVRPTATGARAQAVWRSLPREIEERWRERFGARVMEQLRAALEQLVGALGLRLPEYLTGRYGGFADAPIDADDPPVPPSLMPFSALLSQPLQAFALQYEDGSPVSLMFTANVLRVLDADGIRPRDLPGRSGIARPALDTAIGILAKRRLVELAPDPHAARGKVVALTEAGERARAAHPRRSAAVEADWRARFGDPPVDAVRGGLEEIVVGAGDRSPLLAGLEPPPGTWRSRTPQLGVLPHHPMPRQGGHPDGV